MKRIIALLLVLVMLPVFPVFAAKDTDSNKIIPEAAFDTVTEDVWKDIEALEKKELTAKRHQAPTARDYALLADEVIELVTASQTYVEDSLNRNGDFFTWETTEGVVCGYSPRLRAKANAAGAGQVTSSGVETISYTTKNGPSAADVAVFQPYIGIDVSFTNQYQTEGKSIAQATGGTYTLYKTTNATIDNIADAMESAAVVVFDSHGDTDYYTSSGDYTSRANTSYVCLQSGTGFTSEDQKAVTGTYGTYYHAYYAGSNGSMKYYCVDGTAIANHMEKTAPNNILWMAICLGMATDGMHKPLRAKGVGVVYGYSQSVTFSGDYTWEELFWGQMKNGKTISAAVAYMKEKAGCWDLCKEMYDCNNWYYDDDTYETISEARKNYAAFPIVVSDEDVYPGQGNVDNLQTVLSTWTLEEETGDAPCSHPDTFVEHQAPTCTENGYDSVVCRVCGTVLSTTILNATGHSYMDAVVAATCTEKGYTVHMCKNCNYSFKDSYVDPTGHTYVETVVAATCTQSGYTLYTCSACGHSYEGAAIPALGHNYVDGLCSQCGDILCPCDNYSDINKTQWYHEGIDFVLTRGLMNGMGDGTFQPNGTMTRAMLVTVLWRYSGAPAGYQSRFSDVPAGQWYTDAVAWAAKKGIVNGMSATEFAPDSSITREQLATIIYRYTQKLGIDTTAGTDLSIFPDYGNVSPWAMEAMVWANAMGLVTGSEENGAVFLLPQGNATRAQVATILMRFCTNISTEAPGELPDAVAGYRIETVDRSLRNAGGDILVRHTYDRVILEDGAYAAKVNELIGADMEAFLHDMADYFDMTGEELDEYISSHYGYDALHCAETAAVTYNTDGIFSYSLDLNWWMGGVFNGDRRGLTFNLNTGERLDVTQVVTMDEDVLREKLRTALLAYLDQKYGDSISLSADPNEALNGENLKKLEFYLDGGEIVLCFPTYTFGPGAAGCEIVPTGVMAGN